MLKRLVNVFPLSLLIYQEERLGEENICGYTLASPLKNFGGCRLRYCYKTCVSKYRTHEKLCALLLMCSGDFIVLLSGHLLLFF